MGALRARSLIPRLGRAPAGTAAARSASSGVVIAVGRYRRIGRARGECEALVSLPPGSPRGGVAGLDPGGHENLTDQAVTTLEVPALRRDPSSGPVVIEASGISKSFRIPEHRIDTVKERVMHPFRPSTYRELHALRNITFDVRKGEFFGIVGRNGSGKSTLLKIMASIYRPDAGRVRMAGRVAPFIELGVGFNPELTARENVVLNGVLYGLTIREARRRLDAVLDFSELHDFADLKLKNYSSGMVVRLAFAIMVQADADIMLIDEVLAVGDAAFAQKCMDIFHERRNRGKTIVLVTHDMATVQTMCHRALLLDDGVQEFLGEAEVAALRYYRRNFAGETGSTGPAQAIDPSAPADDDVSVEINGHVREASLLSADGDRIVNVEQGEPLHVDIVIQTARQLVSPAFQTYIMSSDHVVVAGFLRTLDETLQAGRFVRLRGTIENRLVPGRYFLDVWIKRSREGADVALQCVRAIQFVVYGTAPKHGLVTLHTDIEPEVLGP
jgi:ABC-2 type transport system ATP-binding protein